MKIETESEDIAPQLRNWLSEQTRRLIGVTQWTNLRYSARDEGGNMAGGVTGTVSHGVLHVQTLAVSPECRQRGIGTLLMSAIEVGAKENGATCVLVDTLEFEAPGFYQKQGYELMGVVGDQIGRRKFFLVKKLV